MQKIETVGELEERIPNLRGFRGESESQLSERWGKYSISNKVSDSDSNLMPIRFPNKSKDFENQ